MGLNKDGSITLSEWYDGIGESSAQGFADMRNCDPFRKPGYLELALEFANEADTPLSKTFTAVAATDLCTISSGDLRRSSVAGIDGRYKAITFTTTGTLPAGLSLTTIYFITSNGSLTSTAFNVSTTLANAIAGTFVDITDTGTGTHTVTTVNMGTPTYLRDTSAGVVYMQDSNARIWYRYSAGVWVLLKGNTITGAGADTGGASGQTGTGLAIWKNFLITFRSTSIDVYNLTTPGWTNSWQSVGAVADKFPFVSKDGKLYFYASTVTGVRSYLGSITQLTTFDPSSAPTYTYNATALDVPDVITAISDHNDKIVVGTAGDKLYPWDGTATSYDDPITLQEPYAYCLKDFNNVLYIGCGENANIYRTYGTTVEKFVDVSDELINNLQYAVHVGGISFDGNDMLFHLVNGNADVNAVFCANLTTGKYHMIYEYSQGFILAGVNQGAFRTLSVTANTSVLFAGYAYNGVTYIDTNNFFGTSVTSTRYRSYVISPLYEVGTFENPRTFQKMQLILAKPLSTGLGVKVSSRTNLSASFSNSVTFDSTTIGTTVNAVENAVNVETTQFIQFKIELTRTDSAPDPTIDVYTTPTIKSLIVY